MQDCRSEGTSRKQFHSSTTAFAKVNGNLLIAFDAIQHCSSGFSDTSPPGSPSPHLVHLLETLPYNRDS